MNRESKCQHSTRALLVPPRLVNTSSDESAQGLGSARVAALGVDPPATYNGGRVAVRRPGPRQNNIQRDSRGAGAPLFSKGSGPKPVFQRFRCQTRVAIATSRPQLAKQIRTGPNKGKTELSTFPFWCVSWIKFLGLLNAYKKSFPSAGRPVFGHTHAGIPRIRRPMCFRQKDLRVTGPPAKPGGNCCPARYSSRSCHDPATWRPREAR